MSSIGSFERLSNDEVDPVADFIAREQNLLAELEDCSPVHNQNPFLTTNSSQSVSPLEELVPEMDSNPFDPFGVQPTTSVPLASGDMLDGNVIKLIDSNQPETSIKNEIESIFDHEDASVILDETQAPTSESNLDNESITQHSLSPVELPSTVTVTPQTLLCSGNGSTGTVDEQQPQKQHGHLSSVPEPETMVRWRELQTQRLVDKDAREKEANLKLKQQAQSELEEWYRTYQNSLDKRRQENREIQDGFEKERDTTKPGQDWVKVASYCDFVNKSAQGRDLTRMRSVLLKQKQLALSTGSATSLANVEA